LPEGTRSPRVDQELHDTIRQPESSASFIFIFMSTFVGIPNQGVSSKAIDDAEELTSPWDASHTDTFQVGDPQEDDKSLQLGSNGAKFACPFFKRNPEKYRDSRSCTGPGWATVRRTK